MKKLFLLRHAHAEANHKNDLNRSLTDEGILKCQNIASYISEYIHNIDLILSSPSVRTKQTIEIILDELKVKNKQIIYDKDLYNVSEENLLQYISNIEYKVLMSPESILLVNHNPSISHLANFLAQDSTSSPYYLDLLRGLNPGSLVLFQVNIDSWKDLYPEHINIENCWI